MQTCSARPSSACGSVTLGGLDRPSRPGDVVIQSNPARAPCVRAGHRGRPSSVSTGRAAADDHDHHHATPSTTTTSTHDDHRRPTATAAGGRRRGGGDAGADLRSRDRRRSPRSVGGRRRQTVASGRQEVGQQARAARGEDRLGVELDALDGELAVAQPHDHPVGGRGRDLEHVGHASPGRRRASGSGWPSKGSGRPAKTPAPSWWMAEVLPCMSVGAPHDRRRRRPGRCTGGRGRRRGSGSRRPARVDDRQADTPASSGRPGPGEMSDGVGRRRPDAVDVDGVVAVDDRARPRARPAPGRGCRRTSRSCR